MEDEGIVKKKEGVSLDNYKYPTCWVDIVWSGDAMVQRFIRLYILGCYYANHEQLADARSA